VRTDWATPGLGSPCRLTSGGTHDSGTSGANCYRNRRTWALLFWCLGTDKCRESNSTTADMTARHIVAVALALITFTSCSKFSGLTADGVERAIKKAFSGNSSAGNFTVRVNGIREIPAQNSAEAEVALSNFEYDAFHGQFGRASYSGAATVTLDHYNTGWVLKSLSFSGDWGPQRFTMNQPLD